MRKKNIKSKAIELKQQGLSYQQIADQLGIGKTTAYNLINSTSSNLSLENEYSPISRSEDLDQTVLKNTHYPGLVIKPNIGNLDGKQTLELRRREMEHEIQLLKMKNDREDKLLQAKLEMLEQQKESLLERNKSLENDIVLMNEAMTDSPLDSKKAELDSTEPPGGLDGYHTDNFKEEHDDEELPHYPVFEVAAFLREYLNLHNEFTQLETIESMSERFEKISNAFEDWATDKDDFEDTEELRSLVPKISDDIQETLVYFEDVGENETELFHSPRFRSKMIEWLESVE